MGPKIESEEEYHMAMDLVLSSARIIKVLPLAEMIRACDRADAVGWAIDPTLYRDAHTKMDAMRRVFKAATVFLFEVEAVLKKVEG
jgi:hypothetical protein